MGGVKDLIGRELTGLDAYMESDAGAKADSPSDKSIGANADMGVGNTSYGYGNNKQGNGWREVVKTYYTAPASNAAGGAQVSGSNGDGKQTSSSNETDVDKLANEGDVLKILQGQMRQYQPLSDKEVAELNKRRKAHGIVSGISDAVQSLSNLYFTSQYSPNAYDPKNSMSEKARERWEKAKAERQAMDAHFTNLALNYANLLGRKQDREMQAEHWREQLKMQKQQNKQAQQNWKATFNFNKDQADWAHKDADRKFDEGVRQFNLNLEQAKSELGVRKQQLALAWDEHNSKYYMTFNLGSSGGGIKVPIRNINEESVARVFATLPKEVQESVHGKTQRVPDGSGYGYTTEYAPVTMEQKLAAIGAYIGVDVADRNSDEFAKREVVRQALQSLTRETPERIHY